MGSNGTVTELQRISTNWTNVLDEIVKMENKVFPKHESLDKELKKKNSGLLYIQIHGQFVGYVMYSWPTSLSASITKLAVKENYRRQGHGEALLEAAIKKCRTRTVLRLTVHVDPLRTPAVNLYKKFGFRVDALIQGEDKDSVTRILDNYNYILNVLVDKSLISVSYDNKLRMHDLLQEMGREIVCQESMKEPANVADCGTIRLSIVY